MDKIILIDGHAAITQDQNNRVVNIQFLPDDEFTPVMAQGSLSRGQLQMLRNGSFDYVASKPRVRTNSLLIRKARHGRLSGTRDNAWQLTLKIFATEGIDWQKAFVTEPIEVMTDLMGAGRMREILTEMLNRLNSEHDGEQAV